MEKNDEVEENDDETIVILIEYQGLKTKLNNNKEFQTISLKTSKPMLQMK